MKILFFGSSSFSVPFLNSILKSSHNITGVITGVEKIRNRGSKLIPNPVKVFAEQNGLNSIEIVSFDRLFYDFINSLGFDYTVVVSFGKILPEKFLSLAKDRTINLHPSILPKYRGPSPIISALLNGDKETGISLIKIAGKIDSGDIYMQTRFPLHQEDDIKSLEDKIKIIGSNMLIALLDLIEKNNISTLPQKKTGLSYTKIFVKDDMRIDWSKDAGTIFNKVRAFGLSEGCGTTFNGKLFKIIKAKKTTLLKNIAENFLNGQIISADKKGLLVKCSYNHNNSQPEDSRYNNENKQGNQVECISIERIKPQNKNIIDYNDFINGYRVKQGDLFI